MNFFTVVVFVSVGNDDQEPHDAEDDSEDEKCGAYDHEDKERFILNPHLSKLD